jgi:hypothetical protein
MICAQAWIVILCFTIAVSGAFLAGMALNAPTFSDDSEGGVTRGPVAPPSGSPGDGSSPAPPSPAGGVEPPGGPHV